MHVHDFETIEACDFETENPVDYKFSCEILDTGSNKIKTESTQRFSALDSNDNSPTKPKIPLSHLSLPTSWILDNANAMENSQSLNLLPAKNREECIEDDVIVDSGASIHVIGHKRYFVGDLRPCNVSVRCADGKSLTVSLCGDILIDVKGERLLLIERCFIPSWCSLLTFCW